MNEMEEDLKAALEDEALVLVIYNIAQELVQIKDPSKAETRALNIMVGSAFALFQAIQNYKEIKYGKSINNSGRIANSKNGSRLS